MQMNPSHIPASPLRRAGLLLRIILLPAFLSSCDLLEPGPERERAELERSWRNWQLNGGASYSYVQQRLCFCTTDAIAAVRISVRNGLVTERRRLDDNLPVSTELASIWGTVDDLFHLIDEALNVRAASLLVTYDRQYGYPTHIAIDYSTSIADEEITITASGLVLLEAGIQR